jgi:hypothetical protein
VMLDGGFGKDDALNDNPKRDEDFIPSHALRSAHARVSSWWASFVSTKCQQLLFVALGYRRSNSDPHGVLRCKYLGE